MGQLVEVLAVEVEEIALNGALLGANVDEPTAGRRAAAGSLEIGGWALGREQAPERIEVVLGEAVLAGAPVRQPRPDIAEGFPAVEDAGRAGFEVVVDLSDAPVESELELRARFGAETVTIGRLRLRRRWRGDLDLERPPLISLVISCEEADERLEHSLQSIGRQGYGSTELLVVHPPSLPPAALAAWHEHGVRGVSAERPSSAALRNEGIRHSNGGLLLFLEAGRALAAEALQAGFESLARFPEASALIDWSEGYAVAGAMYRRSAFEELRGFDHRSPYGCDLELARRAAAYDALIQPGALVVPGER